MREKPYNWIIDNNWVIDEPITSKYRLLIGILAAAAGIKTDGQYARSGVGIGDRIGYMRLSQELVIQDGVARIDILTTYAEVVEELKKIIKSKT